MKSPWWPSAASTVVGVIGDPVSHSLSPRLHNAAFDAMGMDWVSVGFEVRAGDAAEALGGMRALGIAGLSVTTPHKEAVASCVDGLSDLAKALGAVNCVIARDGRLLGDSTDGEGFLEAVRRGVGFDPSGSRCAVIGAGGAARAVVLALAGAGAVEVVVLNRTRERAVVAAALAGEAGRVGSEDDLPAMDLVVQATSLGMTGRAAGSPAGGGGDVTAGSQELAVDPELLRSNQLVVDLVYHPELTPMLRAAEERGARTLGGLGMLVHQAALAVERWTGREPPVEEMWRAAHQRSA